MQSGRIYPVMNLTDRSQYFGKPSPAPSVHHELGRVDGEHLCGNTFGAVHCHLTLSEFCYT
jgi:hypothetical protein